MHQKGGFAWNILNKNRTIWNPAKAEWEFSPDILNVIRLLGGDSEPDRVT